MLWHCYNIYGTNIELGTLQIFPVPICLPFATDKLSNDTFPAAHHCELMRQGYRGLEL